MSPAVAVHDVPRLLDYGQLGVIALLVLVVVGPMVAIMWVLARAAVRSTGELVVAIRELSADLKADRREGNATLARSVYEIHDHVSDVEERLAGHVATVRYEARAGACRYGQTPRGTPQIEVPAAPRYPAPGDPEAAR